MGSLERADGFKRTVKDLDNEIKRLRRTDSVNVKRDVIDVLVEELRLYQGMYQAEMDIYTGEVERPPRKFILAEDGFSFKLNPKYKHISEEI